MKRDRGARLNYYTSADNRDRTSHHKTKIRRRDEMRWDGMGVCTYDLSERVELSGKRDVVASDGQQSLQVVDAPL